jgi:hypothetical protein
LLRCGGEKGPRICWYDDNDDILYSVNLTTGIATRIGPFPNGSAIMGIAASGGPDVHPRRHAVRR